MLYSVLHDLLFWLLACVGTPALCAVLLKVFQNKLPRDKGREFAVDGEKSAGKIRGAGLVFICSFIVCALLFVPVSLEFGIYYALIFLGMLTGYLDDRSDKPWGEYKKGALDLLISLGTAAAFVHYNPELLKLSFFGLSFGVHPVVYVILGTALVWLLINAVNCSDGIDGFSSTLTTVSLLSAIGVILMTNGDKRMVVLTVLLVLTLFPYLWKNAEPSTMMMGDAGSRALGLFLAILMMKTGNALLTIPLCFMVCLDGLIGILKVSLIRFLHIQALRKIRTPLHDHFRKNKGWSNTQVIYRYCMIQVVISAVTLIALKG
ncbi:MAG: phospho-N-acetylmuramoyl-pentapeptide-transferase [Oscillospiraceae bacterium]|nr:phospho-N-acetylmuramoyl-pentapeptide-transferase [Oscillospiraceae bacterium]